MIPKCLLAKDADFPVVWIDSLQPAPKHPIITQRGQFELHKETAEVNQLQVLAFERFDRDLLGAVFESYTEHFLYRAKCLSKSSTKF